MLKGLLSDDFPRSPVLTVALLAILIVLAFAPFLFGGAQAINTAAKICVFIVLVASYDLLLGYTGICLLYTSPSPRDRTRSRMPSSA